MGIFTQCKQVQLTGEECYAQFLSSAIPPPEISNSILAKFRASNAAMDMVIQNQRNLFANAGGCGLLNCP